jgi:hypothetical protein
MTQGTGLQSSVITASSLKPLTLQLLSALNLHSPRAAPDALLAAWDAWEPDHDCQNERPDMFDDAQLFVVFAFNNGGRDLESFQFSSLRQVSHARLVRADSHFSCSPAIVASPPILFF